MFKLHIFLNAAAALLLNACPIMAETVGTGLILEACNEVGAGNQMCRTYISGTIHGLQWAADYAAYRSGATEAEEMRSLSQTLLGACMPPSVNGDQLYAVATKFMQDHPESWHEPAVVVIHRAVMEAFPCN